jgi:type II secretory pathway pseudopilin PulG
MKRALIVVAVLGLTASLGAQSLVELAQREKERRAQYRGRHAAVITSRELALVKKTGAVVVTLPESGSGDETWAEPGSETAETAYDGGLVTAPSDPGTAGDPGAAAETAEEPLPDSAEALAGQLRAVDELVESLTAEMNALRQRYESQNGMVPGAVILEQMEETNRRLTRVQARQAAIEAKMVKLGLPVRKSPEFAGR